MVFGDATLGATFSEGDTSSIAGFGEAAKDGATHKWQRFEPKSTRAIVGMLITKSSKT